MSILSKLPESVGFPLMVYGGGAVIVLAVIAAGYLFYRFLH